MQPDEIIVSDGFSKDRTRKIAKEHSCIIVNGGSPAKGRNAGAKIAKGDLLLFLDADMVLLKSTFIENFVKSFLKRELDIGTTFIKFNNKGVKKIIAELGFNTTKVVNQVLLRHLKNIMSESGACMLITKRLFEEIGKFNEELLIHEDSDLFLKASKRGAKYGVVGMTIETSGRRYEKMNGKEFFQISYLVLYAYFRRLFGFKDSKKFHQIYNKIYGKLGGEEL